MRAYATIQRPIVLLAVTLAVQILMLAVQIKREGDVRLIRVWSNLAISPFQRAGTWTVDGVRNTWSDYVSLRHVRGENDALRAELGQLKLRNAQLEGAAAEATRLAALLEFRRQQADVPMLAARVVGTGGAESSRTVLLDRGSDDKVARNMAVITPDGVVGKVLDVYARTCQVLLISDRESGAGAILSSTRTLGILRGSADGTVTLDHVGYDETVAPGEKIRTSGLDQIYPKDLPLGTVISAERGNPFKVIKVKPAARLDRLEEVLILLTRQPLNLPAAPPDASASAAGSAPAVSAAPANTATQGATPAAKPPQP